MSYAEYTGKARAALILAEKCARQFGQGYVGSEHILVGLLREKTGVAAVVLQDNGVNEEDVIELIRDFGTGFRDKAKGKKRVFYKGAGGTFRKPSSCRKVP